MAYTGSEKDKNPFGMLMGIRTWYCAIVCKAVLWGRPSEDNYMGCGDEDSEEKLVQHMLLMFVLWFAFYKGIELDLKASECCRHWAGSYLT